MINQIADNTIMENSVCFIGHRRIKVTPELKIEVFKILINLINSGTVNFIFGDHSVFDSVCYNIVSNLKITYPNIQRIKFRTNYQDINEYSLKYFLSGFEDSIFPTCAANAGKASYIKRNEAMILASEVCIFYYNENYFQHIPIESNKSSGTKIAYDFAIKHYKKIINLFKST